MRLAVDEHTTRPWRIHDIAADFQLLDVWALPTAGGPADFGRLVDTLESMQPNEIHSLPTRALFAIRFALGWLLGWDKGYDNSFRPLYQTDDEWAAELVNRTVHGIVHLGWVADGRGGYRGQLAVLVKPKGLLGRLYLAGISPFRHLVVYPALLREIERVWAAGGVR